MLRGAKAKGCAVVSIIAFTLFLVPNVMTAAANGKGNLIGFIYGEDGTTPLAGAVAMVKNVSTGKTSKLGVGIRVRLR